MMLGDKLHTKKQRKYTFYVLKVNINFQRKKKTLKKVYQVQRQYTFKCVKKVYHLPFSFMQKGRLLQLALNSILYC
jgi:hypothetical protein